MGHKAQEGLCFAYLYFSTFLILRLFGAICFQLDLLLLQMDIGVKQCQRAGTNEGIR